MPIKESMDGFEYTIPENYKAMVSKLFLQTLKQELKLIFSDNDFKNEENWINLSSTDGWFNAFKAATEKEKLFELQSYYDSLEWFDRDMFESDVIDLALAVGIIEPISSDK